VVTLHPLAGLAVALLVAWASILIAIRLPIDRFVDGRHLRIGGAAALAILALRILGAPIPAALPLLPIVIGAATGHWARRLAKRRRAGQ
jgi:hypothetical protein